MSRTTVNFLLDALLLVVFTSLAATSVVVRFVFPPGTQADRWILWGHGYDAWVGLQFNILALLALGILFHLMLHWSWVCGVAANRLSKWGGRTIHIDEANQTVYGVGLLVVLFTLIGLVTAAASLQIESKSNETSAARPDLSMVQSAHWLSWTTCTFRGDSHPFHRTPFTGPTEYMTMSFAPGEMLSKQTHLA